MNSAGTLIGLALLMPLAAVARAGPTYHNPVHGYSVTLPDGWAPLNAADLRTISQAVSSAQKAAVLDAAYAPHGKIGSDAEFILISTAPMTEQCDSRGMKQFMRGIALGPTMPNMGGTAIENSKLDEDAHSYTARLRIPAQKRTLHCSIFGFFGRKGVVQVLGYSTDARLAAAEARYAQSAQSFGFDPAFAYDNSEQYVRKIGMLVGAIAVPVVALIVVTLVVRSSRKRPAPVAGLAQFQAPGFPGWAAAAPPPLPASADRGTGRL